MVQKFSSPQKEGQKIWLEPLYGAPPPMPGPVRSRAPVGSPFSDP
jgi:hypothetical protein